MVKVSLGFMERPCLKKSKSKLKPAPGNKPATVMETAEKPELEEDGPISDLSQDFTRNLLRWALGWAMEQFISRD